MRRFLFLLILVWPFTLPPGVCGCCLADHLLFDPVHSHPDDPDHDCDCPGPAKLFVGSSPHSSLTGSGFASGFIPPEDRPSATGLLIGSSESTSDPIMVSAPLFVVHCALLR
jgi:hypothetical protein